ncbi:MAG TPA: hypothetical protein VME92_04260, partial [Acetobacteraceae bacterium]|nr:hypothetical protein [Acetobacteraceae bacterium]
MPGRDIAIGHDAFGNALVTGDNNLTVVLIGCDRVPEDVLARLRAGRLAPAAIPGAIPLPALTLAIAPSAAAWDIAARRATGEPERRRVAAPDQAAPALPGALALFAAGARQPVETPEERARLDAAARQIGDALGAVLSAEEARFLIAAARGDPPPPLLVIESADEAILALPWELIRLDGAFAV